MDNEDITAQAPDVNGGSDREISRLLSGLKRVEAPADFDLRVRGRIADRKPSEQRGFRFPVVVRYASASFAVLLIAAVIGGIWLYSGNRQAVSNVAVVETGPKPVSLGSPSNEKVAVPANDAADDRASLNPPAVGNSVRPAGRTPGQSDTNTPVNRDRPGDSIESSSREATRILPKGLDPNPVVGPKPRDFDRGAHISAADVLSLLGINAAYSDGGWRVNSVAANSAAERVGVRAGDVVEAINDQAITESSSFAGSFSGKSLRVRRDGQVLRIDLTKK